MMNSPNEGDIDMKQPTAKQSRSRQEPHDPATKMDDGDIR